MRRIQSQSMLSMDECYANVEPLQLDKLHRQGAKGLYGAVALGRCKLASRTQTRAVELTGPLPQVDKRDDPYAPQQSGGCGCVVM